MFERALNIGQFHPSDEADGDIAECRHDLRTGPGPDLASVFIKGHVSNLMKPGFNAPMPAHELPDSLARSEFRSQIGHAERDFIAGVPPKGPSRGGPFERSGPHRANPDPY